MKMLKNKCLLKMRRNKKSAPLRVLVVDDEPVLLESICRGLFLYEYESICAAGFHHAVDLIKRGEEEPIDMMLTDLTMPGRSGLNLIEEVRSLRPDLPIVVITGLTTTPEIEEIRKMDIPILQKPFDPEALNKTLESLLCGRHRELS